MQVIGPLFTLYDTNAAAAATIPGFDAGVLKSLSNPNPPVRHHPLLAHAYGYTSPISLQGGDVGLWYWT